MRIAVINEFSACAKNGDILAALEAAVPGAQIMNVGMSDPAQEPALVYIHTGLITGILLGAGWCDFAVGGCGTGQGYLISAMQYPGVFCGLVLDPLDAWLFSQINGGNCVSLALNKGYGWAGDINLRYLFDKLFCDPAGRGYPLARAESQAQSRATLQAISMQTHRPLAEILTDIPDEIWVPILQHKPFMDIVAQHAESNIARLIMQKGD
ncbi:MAG: RpiB/LacA/LacB family sugar-phosphate isomerase [Oscillospiraceae bacterium]|nr:RpiB/LacA/LacB family sugar-phosphate isomerase [Oscillospiraceae bacterium]